MSHVIDRDSGNGGGSDSLRLKLRTAEEEADQLRKFHHRLKSQLRDSERENDDLKARVVTQQQRTESPSADKLIHERALAEARDRSERLQIEVTRLKEDKEEEEDEHI